MKRWKTAATLAGIFFPLSSLSGISCAQEIVFPGAEWESATPESQAVDSNLLQAAVDFLSARISAGRGASELVIARNGRVIWEGPESDRVHVVYSMTKSFATTAVGLLVDDGLVSIDTLAKDYVLDLAPDYPDVTLRHLATHTSGYRAEEEDYPLQPDYFLPDEPLAPGPPLFVPDSRYLYSPTAMEQMMNVLTRVAGEPMQDFFQRRIGTPIGLDPASWDWHDYQASDGMVVEAGSWGISMSAVDAARLGHLFLNQGNWNGEQLISSDWVETATSVQVPASLLEHPNSYSVPLGGVYGYGWWVNGVGADGKRLFPGAPPETFAALGAKENNIIVIPEWNMVITREGTIAPNAAAGTWGDFLSRIGVAMAPMRGAVAFEPFPIYAVFDDDTGPAYDGHGDSGYGVSSLPWAGLGELDFPTINAVDRLVVKFRLPSGPDADDELENATLRFYLENIVGDPAGPVSLFHSVTDNDAAQQFSDYEDASYIDTSFDLVQAADPIGEYYELDVTDLVLADYANDGGSLLSAFRLQVDGATFLEDNQPNYYQLTMAGAIDNRPQLILTFTSELAADLDRDGDVDGDDFLTWQASFGVDDGGDADNDGDTDGDDFLIWQDQFGSSSGLASAAVPEPASIVMLLAAVVSAICLSRRH